MEDLIIPVSALYREPDSRDEFSGTEGAYLLPHHREEIERLQRQHKFIKTACEDSLTPVKLPDGARVLDSGCADGTWLVDLAGLSRKDASFGKHLALYGVDIGSALFRNDVNLDLRQHDLRQPFPESWGWRESFDLVHQRLLVWGIKAEEWPLVLSNLASVVKPGGMLQLVEAEWVKSSYTKEQVQQKRLANVQSWSTESVGMDVHIWKKFPQMLQQLGFEEIKVESYNLGYGATSKRPEDRTWTAELLPQSFRHLARNLPAGGVPGVAETSEEYLLWLDDLVKEMKAIGYTPVIKWTIARKK